MVNGIMFGASHKSPSRGIPALLEKEEGIFSRKEMKNLGRGNFFKLKNYLKSNALNEDFLSRQTQTLRQTVIAPVDRKDDGLKRTLAGLSRSMQENKPTQINMKEFADGITRIIERSFEDGREREKTYEIRPRL